MFDKLKKMLGGKAQPATGENADQQDLLINAYCTTLAPPPPRFAHTLLGRRDLADPALKPHLDGFLGYVQSRGDGQMTQLRYHVLRHIQRVQTHLSLSLPEHELPAYEAWAREANAISFLPDGALRDPQGRLLIDAAGDSEAGAQVPYPREAAERKARSDALLAARGIRVPASLPPLVGETELRLRAPLAAAGRALGLMVVAVRAESLNAGSPLSPEQLRERCAPGFDHLTPAELAFMAQAAPEQQAIVQFAWRYEALALLQWALGWVDELPFPSEICDVPRTVRAVLEHDPQALLREARLRSPGEILDALDLHYRLHWAVREAQVQNTGVPPGLEGGVILERHYALNWLVRFEESEWDEVDTPT